MNNIHLEICPYCNAKIEVSYGTFPCPKCHKLIHVYPDDTVILQRLIKLGLNEVLGKIFRRAL